METILVTGGSGLVGKALHANIKDVQHNFVFVNSADADLRKWDETFMLFDKYKPTLVIHLAANVGGLFKNLTSNAEMLTDNLLINVNVVKACHQFGVKRLLACLSTCIFPDQHKSILTEDDLHGGEPHSSNFGYAYAKRSLEILCRAYNEQYGTDYICVIPTNIYGLDDNYSLKNGHVIPSLIHRFYINQNRPIILSGTGTAKRQFLFASDLAKILLQVLFEYKGEKLLIISPSEQVSIKDIVHLIAKSFSFDKPILFDGNREKDGQHQKQVSNKRLSTYFPLIEFTSLESGIKETVAYLIENFSKCRK